MIKRALFYEGKAKRLYKTEHEDLLISEFKDDLTAFNAQKKASETGKGALNCKISTELFYLLERNGIKTHLIEVISDNEQLIKRCKIIPVEVIVRNIASGSLSRRLGIEDGFVLPFALVELCLKDDDLGDPLINDEHCLILKLLENEDQIKEIKKIARNINAILTPFFDTKELKLIDFKIEFGLTRDNELVLADEISPDSCRLWDKFSHEKLDKDRFRQDLGGVKMAYEEILRRILH